jgi:preprotein translocase subunit Sec61beta
MAKKAGGRLISSAGLVNYYESTDRRAIQVSPYAVAIVSVGIGIIIWALNILY